MKRVLSILICLLIITGIFFSTITNVLAVGATGLPGEPNWKQFLTNLYDIGNKMRLNESLKNVPSLAEQAFKLTEGETNLDRIRYYDITEEVGLMAYKDSDRDTYTVIAIGGGMENFDAFYCQAYDNKIFEELKKCKLDLETNLKNLTSFEASDILESFNISVKNKPFLKKAIDENINVKKALDESLAELLVDSLEISDETAKEYIADFNGAAKKTIEFADLFGDLAYIFMLKKDNNRFNWAGFVDGYLNILDRLVLKAYASYGFSEKLTGEATSKIEKAVKKTISKEFGYNLVMVHAYLSVFPSNSDFHVNTNDISFIFGERNTDITWKWRPDYKSTNPKPSGFEFNRNDKIDTTWGSVDSFGKVKFPDGKVFDGRSGSGGSGAGSSDNGDYINEFIKKNCDDAVSSTVGQAETDFGLAMKIASPILINLDGEGINTIPLSEGVYFDHLGNGFRMKSGWAAPNSGFLVRGVGDSKIITGRNLFGDNTLLKNGQTADNGFEALKDLDDNKDKVFDEQDSAYNEIDLWFDKNSNGKVNAGELTSLKDAGIVSINLNYQNIDQIDSHGNAHKQISTATLEDGKVVDAIDVWFMRDIKDSKAVDRVKVSDEVKVLPQIRGFGTTYSLQQAMMLDSTGQLQNLVEQFVMEDDENVRKNLVKQIIYKWTGKNYNLAALESLVGEKYLGEPGVIATAFLDGTFDRVAKAVYDSLMAQSHYYYLYGKIELISIDDNDPIYDLSPVAYEILKVISYDQATGEKLLKDFIANMYALALIEKVDSSTFRKIMASVNVKYGFIIDYANKNIMRASPEGGTLNGTNGDDALFGGDSDDIIYGDNGNDFLHGNKGTDTLAGGPGSNTYLFNIGDGTDTINNYDTSTSPDKLIFSEGIKPEDIKIIRNGFNLEMAIGDGRDKVIIQNYYNTTMQAASANLYYTIDEIHFADGTVWTIDDLPKATIYANGTQILYGTSGDDILYGNEFNNTIYAGNGNDTIYGDDGNDNIYGEGGNDIIHGGKGTDTLTGGTGSKTYLFNLGDGIDTINNYDASTSPDKLILGEGIKPEDIKIIRNGCNLELIIAEDDKVIIQYYYNSVTQTAKADPYSTIDEIYFADGTVWKPKDLIATIYANGTQILYGTSEDDIIYGNEQNNTIYAGSGNDIIYGEAGNDNIYGDAGNDILHGGKGTDTLSGGTGSKTYLFNLGDGIDTIYNYDTTDTPDKIVFVEGIKPENVKAVRNGYNLEFEIGNGGDKVIIQSCYSTIYQTATVNSYYTIDEICFADGTKMKWDDLANILYANGTAILYGSSANETLYGDEQNNTIYAGAGNDIIYGGAGNDNIYGDAGNDILHGGKGIDTLSGGTGSKTYLFNLGDGIDTIYNYDTTDTPDKIVFGEGIKPENVKAARNGYNLEFEIGNGGDKIIIQSCYSTIYQTAVVYPNYTVDEICFADGTKMKWDDLANILYANGTAILYGTSGDDILYGNEQNNTIYAGSGNDILHGGKGSDTINGGIGSKTYLFNLGDGIDTIYNYDITDTPDKLVFGAGIRPEDIKTIHNGYNLEFEIGNGGDKVIIQNCYSTIYQTAAVDPNYIIDEVHFSDGTKMKWVSNEYVIYETANMNETNDDETSEVDNSIDGTYVYNLGDGIKTIIKNDEIDTPTILIFGEGINPEDVLIARNGRNLEFILNDEDKVIICNYYNSTEQASEVDPYYAIDEIQFTIDGTTYMLDYQTKIEIKQIKLMKAKVSKIKKICL